MAELKPVNFGFTTNTKTDRERLREHGFTHNWLYELDQLKDSNEYWQSASRFVLGVLAEHEEGELTSRQIQWRDKILEDLEAGHDSGGFVQIAKDEY